MRGCSFCLLFLIGMVLPGCGLQEREQALIERETRLGQREQQLMERENQLALKEEALEKQKLQADTISTDSTAFNPDVLGTWSTTMTCIETTCPGSAVGDTKTETWEFSYENNYLVAKAMAGSKVVRIYSGSFTPNKVIQLTATVEPTPTAPATRINIRLTPTTANAMEGQREILRESGCSIIYSLKLTR